MSDNTAVLDGFTEEYLAECIESSIAILVRPGEDLDSTFTAWDMDNQEYIRINGWLWSFEKAEAA